MRLAPNFISHDTGEGRVLVATGADAFSGLARANETAAFLIDLLREETTEAALTERLTQTYEVDRETARRDVSALLARLRSIGALTD